MDAPAAPGGSLTASQQVRLMFYALQPNESSFPSLQEVPDYVNKATPLFIVLMLLEFVASWVWRHQASVRVNDSITSLSAGVLSRLPDVFSRSLELTTYIYVWDNYRLFEMLWDSPWTWYLTFLGVDFGYYWFHRMAHEVNILWAAHQTHHSSEAYNLSTALRQSALQRYASWIFYLPMALFIPPSVYAVHLQFNLLYQFWIHTEVVNNLGPLELILNTPSHHRVHHGRNPYCIDKNYGGTLIIWDRIFGTFVAENDKVIYGLTHPINTFEPFKVQLCHLVHIWRTFWATPGYCNKLSVIFKGPGWGPGKPRLGLPEEIPVITGKEVNFDPKLPIYLSVYATVHFVLMLGFYMDLFENKATLSQVTLLLRIGYIILTLTSIGFLMEQRPKGASLEAVRCAVFLVLHKVGYLKTYIASLAFTYEILFSLCIAFWGVQIMKQLVSSTAKHH
uniref:Alkylglycerol monooxygenase n=1 Tax=Pelodiscus sinensis TaxID=13735 RepID=K7FKL3_PELSI|nr:alkylglycerol monooxygenase [Pelodiscus sinensis]|eukprot:XP_006138384.1 alkylglycerol monooxygenase [Pelodiscus sinensis]